MSKLWLYEDIRLPRSLGERYGAHGLTAKIESEVLARWNYPKGRISINSVDGVVELRGVCETPDQIGELEADVRKVTGVIDVHNYLHLPNTPAPNKEDARRIR